MIRSFLLFAAIALGAGSNPEPLRQVQSISMPDVNGRIDHLSADIKGQRLFVSALASNSVKVIDVKAGRVIHTITGLRGPQGVLFHPESGRLFVACREDGTIKIFDAHSFNLLHTINKFSDADNIRYVSAKSIAAGYADGFIGIFDVDGKQLAEIRLEGHPEAFQIDRQAMRILVNTPTTKNVSIVDLTRNQVTRTWALSSVSSNYAMAFDEANHRLFIACRTPPKVVIFDTQSGLEVDGRVTVADADDIFYDAEHKRIYVSGGDGHLDVIKQVGPNSYEPLAVIPTSRGARTSLFVPEWNRLYLAVPAREKQGAEIRVFEVVK